MSAGFHANAIQGEQGNRCKLRKIYKDAVANLHVFYAVTVALNEFQCLWLMCTVTPNVNPLN